VDETRVGQVAVHVLFTVIQIKTFLAEISLSHDVILPALSADLKALFPSIGHIGITTFIHSFVRICISLLLSFFFISFLLH
jgi:hypothetical protein